MTLQPYLKYYIGCMVEVKHPEFVKYPPVKFIGYNPKAFGGCVIVENSIFNFTPENVKPILRRLSSMTDEEKLELFGFGVEYHIDGDEYFYKDIADNISISSSARINKGILGYTFRNKLFTGCTTMGVLGLYNLNPYQFDYLISKGFWLFGEIAFTDGSIIDADTLK